MKNVAFLLPAGANIASLATARHGFMAANQYLQAQGRAPCFAVRLLAATPQVLLDEGRIQVQARSEEHASELQSLMRISYAVFCLKKQKRNQTYNQKTQI